MVKVEDALAPGAAETEAGIAERPVGGAGAVPRALIRPIPFGVPQPVTRS